MARGGAIDASASSGEILKGSLLSCIDKLLPNRTVNRSQLDEICLSVHSATRSLRVAHEQRAAFTCSSEIEMKAATD